MSKTLLMSRYAEKIHPVTNADKFYLVCLWRDPDSGQATAEATWGRRGTAGKTTVLYQGLSLPQAQTAADNKWTDKVHDGYIPVTSIPAALASIHGI